jgi:hypothetical protein
MNLQEANTMLDAAPLSDAPSRVNPNLTRSQAIEIVRQAINGDRPRAFQSDGITLHPIFEKRVYQVCLNRKRPTIPDKTTP